MMMIDDDDDDDDDDDGMMMEWQIKTGVKLSLMFRRDLRS